MADSADAVITIRRAVVGLGDERVLEKVDSLSLAARPGGDVVILMPLRTLQRGRSVVDFAQGAPPRAVAFLLDLLTESALGRCVELLGESADDPNFEQLSSAVSALLDEGFDGPVVAAMLAVAAYHQVPAAPHCRRLLDEVPVLALGEIEVTEGPDPAVTLRVSDPEKREMRRQRREAQRTARQRQQSRPPSRPARATKAPTPEPPTRTRGAPEPLERRVAPFSPKEAAEFDRDHALAGWVVELEIGFDTGEPDEDGAISKARPALVIAGSDSALLVEPVYSRPGPGRRVLAGWRRIGLDHLSYVDRDRTVVEISESGLRRFGRLNDREWNSLF